MTSSLFSRSATGGATARGGFRYQDDYVLLRLPALLAQGAFESVVSENLGDVEFRYFRPSGGTCCLAVEAKNHDLTPTLFWAEIETFRQMHLEAPTEYVKFALVCPSFAAKVEPLVSMLESLRGRGASLNADSTVRSAAEDAIIAKVVELSQSAELARFVLDRVELIAHAEGSGQISFNGHLTQNLPVLATLRGIQQDALRSRCTQLVQASVDRPVTRIDVETAICDAMGADRQAWLNYPTRCQVGEPGPLEIEDYFLCTSELLASDRASVSSHRWQEASIRAGAIVDRIKLTRPRRGVVVSAELRMSAAGMLGYAFSATRGMRLSGEHRGTIYDFDDYNRSPDPFYDASSLPGTVPGEGIVAIAFSPGLYEDASRNFTDLGIAGCSTLVLCARRPLASAADTTAAVEDAKAAMLSFRASNGVSLLHLFLKGPSFFSMALGHRLNGLGRVQLYDWVNGKYVRTALLA